MLKKIKVLSLLAAMFVALAGNAQVTTSAISGQIIDNAGEEMIGATVVAKHEPSGTTYGTSTNAYGRFNIQGMRVGGPYTVEISYVGYKKVVYEGIYLQLGVTSTLDTKMEASSAVLDELVVVGKSNQTAGAAENFSMTQIQNTPTVDRNIYDVVKNMPNAASPKFGGISFAGTNNRYNSFQIDGTVSNDVFGLASSGTNGGQSGMNPVSLDAIEEIQVVVSPFDVRQSGFTGGGINAITKSGTNQYRASAYMFYNNQNLYGSWNALTDKYDPLGKQHSLTYGGNVGGYIVKDKLFFFVNVENHTEGYPSSIYPGFKNGYISESQAKAIADKYKQYTGIDETYTRKDVNKQALDIMARIDWNINQNNKLTLRYQHANAYDDKYSNGTTSYYFNSSSYRMNNSTNSFVAELNSRLGNDWANEVRASYTRVRDHRDVPYQAPLMYIRNCVGDTGGETMSGITVNIGTEYSSGANYLNQDVYTFEDNVTYYTGSHALTFGTHNEIYQMENLFIQANNGEWVFNGIDAFLNYTPNQFVFKCTDPTITEGNLLYAPKMRFGQFGLYAQDKWDVNRNLQISYGIRLDIPVCFTTPSTNITFNKYAYEQKWDARVGQTPTTKVMASPRVGFRWYTNDSHNTLIRGGIGMFTGRVPFVWLSNSYTNTGIEQTGTTINDATKIPAITTDTQKLIDALTTPGGTAPKPDIVTVAKNFRFPQVLRANLALEQRLPYDINMTIEALYSKTYFNAYFENLALTQVGKVYAVPGVEASAAPYYNVDNKFYSVINTKNDNRGYSYSFSLKLDKSFAFGLNASASYTFGHSKSVYDGTSSVAYSNWKYNYAYDSNNPGLTYSSFDQPHRVIVSVGYTSPKYANGFLQSTIGLIYNGYSGMRYSLTMSESGDYNGDGYKGNSLMYIPTDDQVDLMRFADKKDMTAAEQKAAFKQWLGTDSYTKNHRGQYAERNSNLAPWENRVDLHFAQDFFYLKGRGSKIQFTFDVYNFANMLNNKWGVSYSSTYNVTPLIVSKVAAEEGTQIPTFQWNGNVAPSKNAIYSRWHAQFGFKVTF